MLSDISRSAILPETDLPSSKALIARGKALASDVDVKRCRFLDRSGVPSESAFKRQQAEAERWMFHAQVGWRDPEVTARNMAEISGRVADAGGCVDRYGICLDWSMGYPPDQRDDRHRGTGLVMRSDDDFELLTSASDAAPHFGDFIIGMPAAVENTVAALRAGATSIGNLGQYFTFRLPDWDDDVAITAATVEAIALCAAQSVNVLVHSNLDDGFAARFSDLACAVGAVRIERYIVSDLLGASIGHCFGHTFSDLPVRQAFHLALHNVCDDPGTMIYGNTTSFTSDPAESYAALSAYLGADMAALRWAPTGHALTPIPVTEAIRIPNVDEIVDAQVFAARLSERIAPVIADEPPRLVRDVADRLMEAGERFADAVLTGLGEEGYDTNDPFELLLALRRIGASELERRFGPGVEDDRTYNGRAPVVAASVVGEIASAADRIVKGLDETIVRALSDAAPVIIVATTDVHEYGKRLIDEVLNRLCLKPLDGGISVDADDLAAAAIAGGADAIAISTYNGVAEDFTRDLQAELGRLGCDIPMYIGGRMNHVPDGTNTGIPVDVSAELRRAGAIDCDTIEDMLEHLAVSGLKS